MSAREVLSGCLEWELGTAANEEADKIIEALTAAGYRILGPGDLDAETVERCAEVARGFEGKPCRAADGWTEEQRQFYDSGQVDASTSITSTIRSLTRSSMEGKE